MTKMLRHLGYRKSTNAKVAVVEIQVAGKPGYSRIFDVDALPLNLSDSIKELLDINNGPAHDQANLSNYLRMTASPQAPDGYLKALEDTGRLHDIPSSDIIMWVTTKQDMPLADIIEAQKSMNPSAFADPNVQPQVQNSPVTGSQPVAVDNVATAFPTQTPTLANDSGIGNDARLNHLEEKLDGLTEKMNAIYDLVASKKRGRKPNNPAE